MIYTLALGNLFFFSKKNNKVDDDEEETKKNDLLCRFVVDGAGKQLGESIALDGDIIIIKSIKSNGLVFLERSKIATADNTVYAVCYAHPNCSATLRKLQIPANR